MSFALALLTTLALSAPWERISGRDGMLVERRPLDNLQEIRVQTHTALSPNSVFAVIWNQADYPKFLDHSKQVRILRDSGRERVIYEQVDVPIIQDRDYTTRGWFEHDEKTGLILVYWEAANHLGPPERDDHTRIHRTQGSWTLEPTADGGTDVTYVVASEAGGGVPRFIVERAQTGAAPDFVLNILARAERLYGRRK